MSRHDTGTLPRFDPYKRIDQVPPPVVQKIREIHQNWGVPPAEIAELIEIPVEWVESFLRPKQNHDTAE